jgi:hypothetical protein
MKNKLKARGREGAKENIQIAESENQFSPRRRGEEPLKHGGKEGAEELGRIFQLDVRLLFQKKNH